MSGMNSAQLLTVQELSFLLRVSSCTVYRFAQDNAIPTIRLGSSIRFRKKDIEDWLSRRTCKPILSPEDSNLVLTLPPETSINHSRGKAGGISEMAKLAKSKTRYSLGYGAIYERKTKSGSVRWYLDYRDAGGKRVQKVAGRASCKEEALLALKAAVQTEHSREWGLRCQPKRLTFSEFAAMYIEDYAMQNKRSWRDDQYRLDANMAPFFGDKGVWEITPHLVEQYKARRLQSGVTRSTVNREITILKKMFSLAVDWGYVQTNPASKVKLFSEKDTQKERILSWAEEGRLLEESPKFLKPILMTALNTGMRRGEILGLKWSQVDLERRQIRVQQTKNGQDRVGPINEPLHEVFVALRATGGQNRLVFPNPDTGEPYTDFKKSFKAACGRAGIEGLRFHDLRHTFASRLVEAGVDLITVRDLLGHFSVKVTQRYTHSGERQKAQAVELLAKEPAKKTEVPLHSCYTN